MIAMATATGVCGAAAFAPPGAAAPLRAAADAGDDAFYTPPSPLPAGRPGDVIRSRPAKAGPPAARKLADAWQVMYLSTDANGRPDAVTGIVLVPKEVDRSKAPIVGLGPGTHGPAFRCTPSTMVNMGAFYEQSAVNDMLAKGWAVVVTDYEGYHPNPKTTYVTGRSEGPAVLDGIRAATRLTEAGLSADAKVAVRGYSQGGGAAMWAGETQPGYAPELNLVGVVAGGVPADLVKMGISLNGKKGFGFLAYALVGLDNAYGLNMDGQLTPAGKTAFDNMRAGDCAVELFNDYAGKSIADYYTRSPLADPAWQAAYGANKLGKDVIKAPVFQYHGTNDEIVNFAQAEALKNTYCAAGVKVTWKTWPMGHLTGVLQGNADAVSFLTDRFAGVEATTTC
ncbi:lipase family protein [Actinocorallia longicatena]|uniref:Lipase family protein n=1 Tax=Actinocorallia longicatena TaxID=111803 RepID=A0ABP6QP25_9ACTN